MSKYNSFAFLTCALPSQVGNWVHMQPEVWNRSKNAPYMPFLFSTDIVRLVCQFFIAVPSIESSHCVLIPALQYPELKSGGSAKIFQLRNPAALLGIPSLPFFDISKNLLCTNKRYQCVGAWQRIAAKACLLILRGIFLEGLKVFWRIPQKCFLEKLRLKTNQLCF